MLCGPLRKLWCSRHLSNRLSPSRTATRCAKFHCGLLHMFPVIHLLHSKQTSMVSQESFQPPTAKVTNPPKQQEQAKQIQLQRTIGWTLTPACMLQNVSSQHVRIALCVYWNSSMANCQVNVVRWNENLVSLKETLRREKANWFSKRKYALLGLKSVPCWSMKPGKW